MNKKPSLILGALAGLLLVIPLVAVFFAGSQVLKTPFPPYDAFDLSARILPGDVIRFGIRTIVGLVNTFQLGPTDSAAKSAEQIMAVLGFIVGGVVLSTLHFGIARGPLMRSANLQRDSRMAGLLLSLIFGLPLMLITASINFTATASPVFSLVWLVAGYFIYGLAHGWVYTRLLAGQQIAGERPAEPTMSQPVVASDDAAAVQLLNRRQFLVRLGGATATITVIGAGLGALGARPATRAPVVAANTELTPSSDAVKPVRAFPNASDPLVPATGTRPEYTPLENHYRIDINLTYPSIDLANYTLPITGLVEKPAELTLDQIRGMKAMNQYITMGCISNPIGGDLISTTLWTGVSMQQILEVVQPKTDATWIKISGVDGFEEYLEIDLIRKDPTVMLAYAWDEKPLLDKHGAPLRIHIPNRYGMKQPKWITKMEFINAWAPGYWIVRGWDKEAFIRATSVIDTVAVDQVITKDDKKFVPVGGISWAGPRGIASVEVQVDNGEWKPAQLRAPLSDRTWVVWRYDWPFEAGNHSFTVRCTEKDGTAQITDKADVAPSGATGLHSKFAVV